MRADSLWKGCLVLAVFACAHEPRRIAPDTTITPPVATSTMRCIDPNRCQAGVTHCLETCYKYNHPNGPANDECDQTCRENYCDRVDCRALRAKP